jgi:glycosyltransferase involved in cell wall biosynthesis
MSLILQERPTRPPAPAAPTTLPVTIVMARGESAPPVIDVVIPVYNEQAALEACVRELHEYLGAQVPVTARITIADNASTDDTWQIAQYLQTDLRHVAAIRLTEKGRGRALRTSWAASDARVLTYMDVDLSTDLAALLPLIAPLLSGHSDLAIGSRLARGARVVRGRKRDVISRCYNLILRTSLRAKFSDAQCGFKAITRDAAHLLLPLVADDAWFFDTELLVLAERAGLRIYEIPVDWTDDPNSSVDIVDTAVKDLRGVMRVGRSLITRELPLIDIGVRLGRIAPTPRSI